MDDAVLNSWKEIAAHLKCDIKTCQRWERKFGMPVRRPPGAVKSRVFVYIDELESWRKHAALDIAKVQSVGLKKRRMRTILMIPALVLGLGLITSLVLFRKTTAGRPADFRIEESTLVGLDDAGRTLWQYNTGVGNLCEESLYREHFQTRRKTRETDLPLLPYLQIKDLDGDGRVETLFSIQTLSERDEGLLLCLNSRGAKLWSYKAGREIVFGKNVYSADYRIEGLDARDLDGDGAMEVVLIASQYPHFPSQLAVLSHEGRVLGEYWNSGRLNDLAFADLDADGREDIIVAGTNNEHQAACLIVFDPSRISGGSPQRLEKYVSRDIGLGTQKYYGLLPRPEADLRSYPNEAASSVDVLQNRRLSVRTLNTKLEFEFDYRLRLVEIKSSHAFQQLQVQAVAAGLNAPGINDDNLDELGKRLQYWDGKEWVAVGGQFDD